MHLVRPKSGVSELLITRNNFNIIHYSGGRCGGLMVSALVPGASGPGSSPGRGTLCCVFGQDT